MRKAIEYAILELALPPDERGGIAEAITAARMEVVEELRSLADLSDAVPMANLAAFPVMMEQQMRGLYGSALRNAAQALAETIREASK